METDQIMYCIVALILGMLLANMLKSVCGCKGVVEGQSGQGTARHNPEAKKGKKHHQPISVPSEQVDAGRGMVEFGGYDLDGDGRLDQAETMKVIEDLGHGDDPAYVDNVMIMYGEQYSDGTLAVGLVSFQSLWEQLNGRPLSPGGDPSAREPPSAPTEESGPSGGQVPDSTATAVDLGIQDLVILKNSPINADANHQDDLFTTLIEFVEGGKHTKPGGVWYDQVKGDVGLFQQMKDTITCYGGALKDARNRRSFIAASFSCIPDQLQSTWNNFGDSGGAWITACESTFEDMWPPPPLGDLHNDFLNCVTAFKLTHPQMKQKIKDDLMVYMECLWHVIGADVSVFEDIVLILFPMLRELHELASIGGEVEFDLLGMLDIFLDASNSLILHMILMYHTTALHYIPAISQSFQSLVWIESQIPGGHFADIFAGAWCQSSDACASLNEWSQDMSYEFITDNGIASDKELHELADEVSHGLERECAVVTVAGGCDSYPGRALSLEVWQRRGFDCCCGNKLNMVDNRYTVNCQCPQERDFLGIQEDKDVPTLDDMNSRTCPPASR